MYSIRLSQKRHQFVTFWKMVTKINNFRRVKWKSSGIWRRVLGRVVYVSFRYLIALFLFRVILNCFTLKKKALRYFETSENTPPRDTTSHLRRLQFPAAGLQYLQFCSSADNIRGGCHFICLWKLGSWVN